MHRRVAAAVVAACWWGSAAQAGLPDGVPSSEGWVAISTEELRADFDVLWAASDVHGRLEELDALLLAAHLATRDAANRVVWNPGQRRQLFVAVGINTAAGRRGAGVVLGSPPFPSKRAGRGGRAARRTATPTPPFPRDQRGRVGASRPTPPALRPSLG